MVVTISYIRVRLQRTSGKWGGFEISDIPGRGEGVVCESPKISEKIEIPKFLGALQS